MKVEINDYALSKNFKRLLLKLVKTANKYSKFNQRKIQIDISFVDKQEIKKLNKEYRNIDKETDVLSFPTLNLKPMQQINIKDYKDDIDPKTKHLMLGDIIICEAVAKEHAEEYSRRDKCGKLDRLAHPGECGTFSRVFGRALAQYKQRGGNDQCAGKQYKHYLVPGKGAVKIQIRQIKIGGVRSAVRVSHIRLQYACAPYGIEVQIYDLCIILWQIGVGSGKLQNESGTRVIYGQYSKAPNRKQHVCSRTGGNACGEDRDRIRPRKEEKSLSAKLNKGGEQLKKSEVGI